MRKSINRWQYPDQYQQRNAFNVTRTGNDVLINGVKIEGEAIPVGKSYVYVVPK